MAETTASKKTITLKTFDRAEFTVEEPAAKLSQTINRMIEDGVPVFGIAIPILNVTSKTLSKVIEYCNKHADSSSSTAATSSSSITAVGKAVAYSSDDGKYATDLLTDWDVEFVNADYALFDLILAANYLNIKSLLDLNCKTVADKMIGRSPEEIRGNFHIQNDYTLEDEDKVRRENQWAFE